MTNQPSPVPVEPAPPPVVGWFKIYTGAMTGLYFLCLLASPLLFWIALRTATDEKVVLLIQAGLLLGLGLVLSVAYALPFFVGRKPWVWIYDLVLICIGMTSCCILPAAIALLIYWIKPEAKAWFYRT